MANKIQLIIEADDQASTKFKRLVSNLEKGISSTDAETQKLNTSSHQLGSTLKWVGGIFVTYLGVRVIRGFSESILDAGIKMDRFEAGLKGALGTAELAGESMEWLRGVSEDLGLVFESQVGAFQKLAAAARDTSLEGDATREIFQAVAEASTAMQLSAEETEGALYAISQMISKGRVAAEELRGQLGERLPGAFQIAARSMGVTTQELSKMLEMGEVVADDFLPKFAKQLRSELGDAAYDAANTTERNLNRLTNAWFEIRTDVAEDVMPQLNESLWSLLNAIKELQRDGTLEAWAGAIGTALATTVRWVQDAIGFWTKFLGIGPAAELDKVRTELDNLNQQLRQGGVEFVSVGETMVDVGENTAELEKKIEALKQREIELVQAMQAGRNEFELSETSQVNFQTTTDSLTQSIKDQKEAFKELDQGIKEWNETYDAMRESMGEEREGRGGFGKLFGIETLFPTQEEWEQYRELYNENLEVVAEDTGVHYEGLKAGAIAYLDNLRKEHEKTGKAITKDDATNQKILQQQTLQTAQLQMQTAQLVAQTMIAISGEEHGALFYLTRTFATVQAVINAWLAYTNALANIPPPANVPIAKWTLASGLAAAALIAAQTFTGKQKGGWLQGGSGVRDDLYIGTVGQTAYLAQGGEFIVNKQAAQENADILEAINAGMVSQVLGGSDQPIIVHNYITVELEGERLGEFIDERVYESSKAGRRLIHSRGIVS